MAKAKLIITERSINPVYERIFDIEVITDTSAPVPVFLTDTALTVCVAQTSSQAIAKKVFAERDAWKKGIEIEVIMILNPKN